MKDEEELEATSEGESLTVPQHLRRTYDVISKKGHGLTAAEIVFETGRSLPLESDYLNQLLRFGLIKKKRDHRRLQTVFYIEFNKLKQNDELVDKVIRIQPRKKQSDIRVRNIRKEKHSHTLRRYAEEVEQYWQFIALEGELSRIYCHHEIHTREWESITNPILKRLYRKQETYKVRDKGGNFNFKGTYGSFSLRRIPIPSIPLLSYIVSPDFFPKLKKDIIEGPTRIIKPLHARILYHAFKFMEVGLEDCYFFIPTLDFYHFTKSLSKTHYRTFTVFAGLSELVIQRKMEAPIHFIRQRVEGYSIDDHVRDFLLCGLPEILTCLKQVAVSRETEKYTTRFWDILFEEWGVHAVDPMEDAITNLTLFAECFVKHSSPVVLPLLSRARFIPDHPLDPPNRTLLDDYF